LTTLLKKLALDPKLGNYQFFPIDYVAAELKIPHEEILEFSAPDQFPVGAESTSDFHWALTEP
jgi:hypothetical protein